MSQGSDPLTELLAPEVPLREWVGDQLPGSGPFTIERVTAGRSNEMFAIRRDGQQWMVRRPPRDPNVPGAHDVTREFRVAKALAGTDVPHAEHLLLCTDSDVIGAPFIVMEWVSGIRLYDALPDDLSEAGVRETVGRKLFTALANLHCVDWRAAGLEGFGAPDTFTQRQVRRWMGQYERVATRDIPGLREVAVWLEARVPTMQRSAIVHGDFGLHNVLYAPTRPVELRAVLDWETATIGDPLLDVGYLLTLWLDLDESVQWFASALPYDPTGFPSRLDMAELYAEHARLDLTNLDWYRALAQFRVSCILEAAYARHLSNGADNPGFDDLERAVPNHAAFALAITRGDA